VDNFQPHSVDCLDLSLFLSDENMIASEKHEQIKVMDGENLKFHDE